MEKSRAPQRTKKLRSHPASKNQTVLLLANFTYGTHSVFSGVSKVNFHTKEKSKQQNKNANSKIKAN